MIACFGNIVVDNINTAQKAGGLYAVIIFAGNIYAVTVAIGHDARAFRRTFAGRTACNFNWKCFFLLCHIAKRLGGCSTTIGRCAGCRRRHIKHIKVASAYVLHIFDACLTGAGLDANVIIIVILTLNEVPITKAGLQNSASQVEIFECGLLGFNQRNKGAVFDCYSFRKVSHLKRGETVDVTIEINIIRFVTGLQFGVQGYHAAVTFIVFGNFQFIANSAIDQ